jgi:hypothetical protein
LTKGIDADREVLQRRDTEAREKTAQLTEEHLMLARRAQLARDRHEAEMGMLREKRDTAGLEHRARMDVLRERQSVLQDLLVAAEAHCAVLKTELPQDTAVAVRGLAQTQQGVERMAAGVVELAGKREKRVAQLKAQGTSTEGALAEIVSQVQTTLDGGSALADRCATAAAERTAREGDEEGGVRREALRLLRVAVRAHAVHQAAEEAAHEKASPGRRGTMHFHNPIAIRTSRADASVKTPLRHGNSGLAGWGVGDTPPHSPTPS